MAKLVICSPELGISPESNLGGEVHDREMIKALDNLGVEMLIILPFGKKYPALKHAKIYFLPTPFVWPPTIFNFLILPYLFFLYQKHKFSVLRIHSPNFVGLGAVIFKKFFPNVRIVATYHHLDGKMNAWDRFLLKSFDLVTAVSEKTKRELDCPRVRVIPNGVDSKYKPGPKNPMLVEEYHLQNKKILLYLGQLIPRKNIPFLFKVIKKLPKIYVLIIAGDGPLRKKFEQTAPEEVIFTGRVPEQEKVDYYNLADIFVYPSKKEGFGLSVAEALACGKPVVAANVPIVENTPLDIDLWVKKITYPLFPEKFNFSWEKSAKLYLAGLSKKKA